MMSDNAEVGKEPGSGGVYEYLADPAAPAGGYDYPADPAYGNGNQGLGPELYRTTNGNDSDRNLDGGVKQGRNGRRKPSFYDYYGKEELGQVFHPKVRERDFMAESRFQNYLTDLVNIFQNMN